MDNRYIVVLGKFTNLDLPDMPGYLLKRHVSLIRYIEDSGTIEYRNDSPNVLPQVLSCRKKHICNELRVFATELYVQWLFVVFLLFPPV